MKEIKAFAITIFFIICLLLPAIISFAGTYNARKATLAIFPFNNVRQNSFDMNIPAMLHDEFSHYEFIEIVPVEVISEKLYEIEPLSLWTERDGPRNRGGILWNIEPKIVEKINETVTAQFAIYGDLITFGDTWRIDVFVMKGNEGEPEKSFRLVGMKDKDIPHKLTEMSESIAHWLKREFVLSEAEEDMRMYMGRMYSYQEVLGKMKKHVSMDLKSVPLLGLLLDLYLKDKGKNQDDIINDGLMIIALLEQSDDEDVRYLLSLNLDPFDVVADMYERIGNWESAIAIRKNALRLFPFKSGLHKKGLGRNHYFLARSFEEKEEKEKAAESYKIAVTYLQPSSEYFEKAMDGLGRLEER